MVIFCWIMAIIVFIVGVLLSVFFAGDMCDSIGGKIASVIGFMTVACLIIGGIMWWLYGTEGGKRAHKTFKSETSGGLERTVRVYDMEGDLLQQYEGKFDIEERMEESVVKVKFDCDGKRHIVYCSTGTVVIDEK